MNSLDMLSVYNSTVSSVYNFNQVSFVQDKQESSDEIMDISSASEIKDEAIISSEAQALLKKEQDNNQGGLSDKDEQKKKDAEKVKAKKSKSKEDLTSEEQNEVAKLKSRDAEVKTHEQSHVSASSGINASAPSYEYEIGPDGKKYAVAGEVNISFSKSENPEENITNAEAMKAAALAPAEPSSQDLAVAREAEAIISEAKQELADKKEEPTGEKTSENKEFDKTD